MHHTPESRSLCQRRREAQRLLRREVRVLSFLADVARRDGNRTACARYAEYFDARVNGA